MVPTPSETRDLIRSIKRVLTLPTLMTLSWALFVLVFGLFSNTENFEGHAAGHWVQAIPVGFAALAIAGLPEASTSPRRVARLFLAIVVSALAGALLLEGLGAFADGGNAQGNSALENMHRLGEATTLFAILAAPLALAGLTIVYVSAAIRWVIKRRSFPTS